MSNVIRTDFRYRTRIPRKHSPQFISERKNALCAAMLSDPHDGADLLQAAVEEIRILLRQVRVLANQLRQAPDARLLEKYGHVLGEYERAYRESISIYDMRRLKREGRLQLRKRSKQTAGSSSGRRAPRAADLRPGSN
jgi:hypothetical protein